jgi:signal transduction histidine kinase/GAF domain-containing protein
VGVKNSPGIKLFSSINIPNDPVSRSLIALLLFRCAALVGIFLYFFQYSDTAYVRNIELVRGLPVFLLLATLVLLVVTYVYLKKNRTLPRTFDPAILIADMVVISFVYYASGFPNADVFWLYMVPISWIVTRFQTTRVILGLCFSIVFTMIWINFSLVDNSLLPSNLLNLDVLPATFREFLPNLFVLSVAAVMTRLWKKQNAKLEASLSAISSISLRANINESFQSILDDISHQTAKILGAEAGKIYLFTDDHLRLQLVSLSKDYDHNTFKPQLWKTETDKGVFGKVIQTAYQYLQQTSNTDVSLREACTYHNEYSKFDRAHEELIDIVNTIICAPLVVGNQVIGAIGAINKNRFTDLDLEIVFAIALQSSVLIYEKIIRDKYETLNAVVGELPPLRNSPIQLLERFHKLAYFDKGTYYRVISKTKREVDLEVHSLCKFSTPPGTKRHEQLSEFITSDNSNPLLELIRKDISHLHIADCQSNLMYKDFFNDKQRDCDSATTQHWLGIPLRADNQSIGVIVVERSNTENSFGIHEVALLRWLARHFSTIIDSEMLTKVVDQYKDLGKLADSLMISDDIRSVANKVVLKCVDIFQTDQIFFHEFTNDGRSRIIHASASKEGQLDTSGTFSRGLNTDPFMRRVMKESGLVIYENRKILKAIPEWSVLEKATENIQAWAGIPLKIRDHKFLLFMHFYRPITAYASQLLRLLAPIMSRVEYKILGDEFLIQLKELEKVTGQLGIYDKFIDNNLQVFLLGLLFTEDLHITSAKLSIGASLADSIANRVIRSEVEINEVKRDAAKIKSTIDAYQELVLAVRQRVIDFTLLPLNLDDELEHVLRSKRIRDKMSVQKLYDERVAHVVIAPRNQLRSVFFVVIDNAKKAIIRSRKTEGALKVELKITTNADISCIEVVIYDNGDGISASNLEEIFDVNLPSDVKSKSRGFGLAWVYSFLRSFGGNVKIDSTIGHGTSVHLIIPRNFQEPIPREIIERLQLDTNNNS